MVFFIVFSQIMSRLEKGRQQWFWWWCWWFYNKRTSDDRARPRKWLVSRGGMPHRAILFLMAFLSDLLCIYLFINFVFIIIYYHIFYSDFKKFTHNPSPEAIYLMVPTSGVLQDFLIREDEWWENVRNRLHRSRWGRPCTPLPLLPAGVLGRPVEQPRSLVSWLSILVH